MVWTFGDDRNIFPLPGFDPRSGRSVEYSIYRQRHAVSVLVSVTELFTIFWDVTSCSLKDTYRDFKRNLMPPLPICNR